MIFPSSLLPLYSSDSLTPPKKQKTKKTNSQYSDTPVKGKIPQTAGRLTEWWGLAGKSLRASVIQPPRLPCEPDTLLRLSSLKAEVGAGPPLGSYLSSPLHLPPTLLLLSQNQDLEHL